MLGAVEAGGTKVVVAVGDAPGSLRERAELPTTTGAETLAAVRAWFAQRPVEAFGVASFGPLGVDPARADHGRILATPKRGWQGADWVAALRGAHEVPVAVDTDVAAAALAERALGAGRGCDDLVYVTVGTGIGMGVLVRGAPVHGVLHPEAGHLRVRRRAGDRFAGVCPFHGDCLEGIASGPAVAAAAGCPAPDVAEDHPVWLRVAHALGEAVAVLTLTLAPERVVLGGGVLRRAHLLPAVRSAAADALGGYARMGHTDDAADYVVAAALGQDAGIHGALVLAASLEA